MRLRRLGAHLIVAALLVAACGGEQKPAPLPAAATTSTTAPSPPPLPTPSATPAASPATALTVVSRDASLAPADTRLRPTDSMPMVYVPGGSFSMGSLEDDPEANPDEIPQHAVTLDGFWLDQTEVTNAQFVQFLNEHGNSPEAGANMIVLDQGYVRLH